jgi:LysR family glycine cleavage system transcriptional activator
MSRKIKLSSTPLGALRSFEAAARHGSFKLAALELSVTPAAISHQLASLEAYLGVELFTRSNRLVQLTPSGNTLSKQLTKSFVDIQRALEFASATTNKPGNTLVVSAAPSLTVKWLVPRLARFHARHPEVDLRLSSENQTHDLMRDATVDVVLRYGKGNYADLHAERLWEETFLFPVCSPNTFAKANPLITQVRDLADQTLLRLPLPRHQITNEIGERWQAWLDAIGCDEQAVYQQAERGPFYSHEHLAIDTAKAGHGISLALDVLVIEELLSKQLMRPLGAQVQCADPYSHWLLYREEEAEKPHLNAFVMWIRDEAAASKKVLDSWRGMA